MKVAYQPWNLPSKRLARRVAVALMGRRARIALFLPGRRMLCVKAALQSGLISLSTRCIFVERDPDVAAAMQAESAMIDWKTRPYFHVGTIETLHLAGLLGEHRIDYVFLDFCAALTAARAKWIKDQLAWALAEDATVAMTLNRTTRNNKFIAVCRNYFGGKGRHELTAAHRSIAVAPCVGNTDGQPFTLRHGVNLADRVFFDGNRPVSPTFHDSSIQAVGILQGLLPQHQFEVDGCIEYSHRATSGTRMGMIRVGNVRRRKRATGSNMLSSIGDLVGASPLGK